MDTRDFNFGRLSKEYDGMDTQVFKGVLGSMRDVLGEIQSDMYKSLEKNKPAKSKEQERFERLIEGMKQVQGITNS